MSEKNKDTDLGRRKTLATLGIGAASLPFLKANAASLANPADTVTLLPNEKGPFDVVITGGRILDPETRLDITGNIGIKQGRIAAISKQPLQGTKTVDASGLIVAPGFIDLHAHGQQMLGAWMQAFDGVTTQLELESGLLPITTAYKHVGNEGRPINYGFGVAWAFARAMVMDKRTGTPDGTLSWFQQAFSYDGWQNTLPDEKQLEQILLLVEKGLAEGGLGISINAGYAPGMGRKEYYALAEMAKKYDVATYTHDRYMSVLEPQSSFEALGEQIGLAAITGAHMHVCHINSVAGRDLKAATDLLKQAQSKDINVSVESYTYGAFSTAIGADFMRGPEWLARFGGQEYSAVEFNGKALNKQSFDELQTAEPGAPIIFHFLSEETSQTDQDLLDLAVMYPGGAIASDGMPWFRPDGSVIEDDVWPAPDNAFSHPRGAGCFSRLFARWVRERGVLPLMDAIEKCTLIPAKIAESGASQLKKKGRIQVGCDADITMFDLETIQDNANFTNPRQTSSGHKHVMVNGSLIIENGNRIEGNLPGQAIRNLK
ncbi:amidohydrolase family protein [Photobacterium rosenbergii]|uniref:amidohydrolase family protein n=1 Tax=Photobacterium rosenbergii TaxID=294936 RepID=UPI001C998CCB|nr:amidohydrolase family protein [Photobacterium rosenbergii]MBY5947809.1 amidohydrolase family protein [Photobacterium rosenbergii]